jgi:hypothetical protein
MNNKSALAGLLTYSPLPGLPAPVSIGTVTNRMDNGYGAYSCGTVTELRRIPF